MNSLFSNGCLYIIDDPFADPKCPSRYHCTHEAGVHSVGLTWIHELDKFLRSGELSVLFSMFHRFYQKVV